MKGGTQCITFFRRISVITLWSFNFRTYKFCRISHVGEGRYVFPGGYSRPHRNRRDHGAPGLTYSAQIQLGNAWGRGRGVLGVSHTVALHKCVARFVSDSYVSCFLRMIIENRTRWQSETDFNALGVPRCKRVTLYIRAGIGTQSHH